MLDRYNRLRDEALKNSEKNAAVIYLNNANIEYNENDFIFPKDDAVDVYCPRLGYKFQVTSVKGDTIRLYRDDHYESGSNLKNAFQDFIIKPIEKKYMRYRGGSAVNDVILLIHTLITPPLAWIEPNTLERKSDLIQLAKRSGFKSIYLTIMVNNQAIHLFSR